MLKHCGKWGYDMVRILQPISFFKRNIINLYTKKIIIIKIVIITFYIGNKL